jgi:hypothetical protein
MFDMFSYNQKYKNEGIYPAWWTKFKWLIDDLVIWIKQVIRAARL